MAEKDQPAGRTAAPDPTSEPSPQERLVEALLSDRGLQHLIEVTATVLGNPVLVVDPGYRYIARAGATPEPDDDSAWARAIRRELEFGSVTEEGVSYIESQDIDRELASARGPVTRHNELLGLDTMTQAVVVHGVCLARVMTVAATRPFRPADTPTLSLAARLVGQELQKGEVFAVGSAQMGSYFLARLLQDEQPTPAATQRRLGLIGFDPLPALFVVALEPRSGRLGARGEESLRNQLGPLLSHSLAALYDGTLVALVSREAGPSLTPLDKRTLRRVATANELNVGVSNAFSDICEVRRHLAQARAAIRFGSTFTKILDDDGVYQYCEYNPMELLDFANDHVNVLNYVHPAIWALLEHDRAHSSELVETLFAYLQNGCNTARTALLLSLHKNTLLYRLGRIKEITGNDLASGEDLFLFHLAIRALIYLGLLETRTKPRTSADLHAAPGEKDLQAARPSRQKGELRS